MQKIKLFIILFIAIASTGCTVRTLQAYKGPAKPLEETAVIQGYFTKHKLAFNLNERIQIIRVDQKNYNYILAALFPITKQPKIYLLPGKHNLTLKFKQGQSFATGKVWFVAEAGKSYTARGTSKGYSVHFWIEDNSTGLPVGGAKGSSDEPASTN